MTAGVLAGVTVVMADGPEDALTVTAVLAIADVVADGVAAVGGPPVPGADDEDPPPEPEPDVRASWLAAGGELPAGAEPLHRVCGPHLHGPSETLQLAIQFH